MYYVGKNLSIQLEDFNDPSSDSFQLLWLSIITNDDSIFFFFFWLSRYSSWWFSINSDIMINN